MTRKSRSSSWSSAGWHTAVFASLAWLFPEWNFHPIHYSRICWFICNISNENVFHFFLHFVPFHSSGYFNLLFIFKAFLLCTSTCISLPSMCISNIIQYGSYETARIYTGAAGGIAEEAVNWTSFLNRIEQRGRRVRNEVESLLDILRNYVEEEVARRAAFWPFGSRYAHGNYSKDSQPAQMALIGTFCAQSSRIDWNGKGGTISISSELYSDWWLVLNELPKVAIRNNGFIHYYKSTKGHCRLENLELSWSLCESYLLWLYRTTGCKRFIQIFF